MILKQKLVIITYIGIGANLGNTRASINDAIKQLSQLPHTILHKKSSLYRTIPIDAFGNDYTNAVVQLTTTLSVLELLKMLQAIECIHGRKRFYKNSPRTLDLDILLYGNKIINSKKLTIPHPRILQRAFVLVPMLEINETIIIPQIGSISHVPINTNKIVKRFI